jgi:hypothetical protein
MSLGGSSASLAAKGVETAAKAGEMAAKVVKTVQMVSKFATILNGLNTIQQGAVQGYSAYLQYQASMSEADKKELEAVLEKIKVATGIEEDFLKAVMERLSDLMEDVKQIVTEKNQALLSVMTGSAPQMA